MPFVKGQIANPKGRPKGIKSKRIEYWDNFKDYILTTGLKTIPKDMEVLGPKDRIAAVISLMEYFKPKLSRNTHVSEIEKDTLHSLTGLYKKLADSKSQLGSNKADIIDVSTPDHKNTDNSS